MFVDHEERDYLNYMAVLVMQLSLVKIAVAYLNVKEMSILIRTVFAMLGSTNNIVVIMVMYMLCFTQISSIMY
jgi:hypothetical protein